MELDKVKASKKVQWIWKSAFGMENKVQMIISPLSVGKQNHWLNDDWRLSSLKRKHFSTKMYIWHNGSWGGGWVGENGQFSFILRPTGPSAPLNFQFSIFFLVFTSNWYSWAEWKSVWNTAISSRQKKIWKIVVLPWIWKGLFQMEWGSDCYEPSENILSVH